MNEIENSESQDPEQMSDLDNDPLMQLILEVLLQEILK